MTKIRTGRFILVVVLTSAVLGVLAAVLKQALGISSTSTLGALLGGALISGGILCVIVILNWLIRHRHFKWLERQ